LNNITDYKGLTSIWSSLYTINFND